VLGRKVIANASVDQERSSKAAGKLKAGHGQQRGFAISRQNVYLGVSCQSPIRKAVTLNGKADPHTHYALVKAARSVWHST